MPKRPKRHSSLANDTGHGRIAMHHPQHQASIMIFIRCYPMVDWCLILRQICTNNSFVLSPNRPYPPKHNSSNRDTTLLHRITSLIQTTTRPFNATKPGRSGPLFISKTPSLGPPGGMRYRDNIVGNVDGNVDGCNLENFR